ATAADDNNGLQATYRVYLKQEKQNIDVMLHGGSGSGFHVAQVAKDIAAGDLPKPVTDALNAKYPRATLKTVREVTRTANPADKTYDVTITTTDTKTLRLGIRLDGTFEPG